MRTKKALFGAALGAVLLAAGAGGVGCGGSERTIVVMPPGGGEAAEQGGGAVASKPSQVAGEEDWGILGAPEAGADYAEVVRKVAGMVHDEKATRLAQRRGLDVVNVSWEDTGRDEGSSVGPNISDLTLQVRMREREGGFRSELMPVIRFPNFSDRTGDVPADKFFVRVGNERAGGGALRSVPLTAVLRNLKAFSTAPASLEGSGDLLAARDTHFLVSAQAVFLPIPKEGKAQFNPVVFNYQSAPRSPAVLTLLVTREGTSVSVIENRGEDMDPSGMGQELYFNNKGQRAAFTAERKSDVEARIESQGGPKTEDDRSALQKGADVLFLVQVPLKQAPRRRVAMSPPPSPMSKAAPSAEPAPMADAAPREESDVEQAVLGHGPNLGPYAEGRGTKLVRDARFPIRITVQFYKATSNGVVDDKDLDGIAKSIGGVYEHAAFVGSLVVPEGDPARPTAWKKIPPTWFPW